MNALTKAFVVVVTILSVVLVALVIPFAARVDNYAQQFEEMKQDRDTQLALAQEAATKVRNEIAKAGTDVEKLAVTNADLLADLGAANNQIKSLQTQLDQARTTANRGAAALEIAVRDGETKSQQVDKQSGLIQEQLAAIAELQSQRGDLSQSLIETRSQIRRLSDNYMRIQEQNKALNQQLLESQAALKVANEQLAVFNPDSADTPVAPEPPVAIRGSVTKIDQITDGITFVQVNVGKRDLVKPGMEFTVSRGDAFIAKVKISSVDTAEAVGELTLGGGVQEGDLVRAGGR